MRWTTTLLLAVLTAACLAGCGKPNPLGPDDNLSGGRDTIIVVTPPDTCPPCPTCPPDTTTPPPPGTSTTYVTAAGRIHEAQSHATLVTNIVIGSRRDQGTLVLKLEYENRQSQLNENCHVYFRDVNNFANKFDMTFPLTGTQVVPDPAGFSGWLERRLIISNLPPGHYVVEIQQDLPNHHSPGESDIRFDPGQLSIQRQ